MDQKDMLNVQLHKQARGRVFFAIVWQMQRLGYAY